jgi:hypothetical protein
LEVLEGLLALALLQFCLKLLVQTPIQLFIGGGELRLALSQLSPKRADIAIGFLQFLLAAFLELLEARLEGFNLER